MIWRLSRIDPGAPGGEGKESLEKVLWWSLPVARRFRERGFQSFSERNPGKSGTRSSFFLGNARSNGGGVPSTKFPARRVPFSGNPRAKKSAGAKKILSKIQQIRNGFFNLSPFPFIFTAWENVVTLL
jgi:hypothetical protein